MSENHVCVSVTTPNVIKLPSISPLDPTYKQRIGRAERAASHRVTRILFDAPEEI